MREDAVAAAGCEGVVRRLRGNRREAGMGWTGIREGGQSVGEAEPSRGVAVSAEKG